MRKLDEHPEFLVGIGPDDSDRRRWVVEVLLIIAILVVIATFASFLTSCKPKPPVIVPSPSPTATPTPTPTPEPTPTPQPEPQTFAALRLTTRGSDFVRESDPTYQMRKCVACCKATQGTGWPGLSIAEIDFLHAQGLCNLLQWRVGPFSAANEPEWVATGGGAYVEVDGKADLTQLNQPYWDALTAAGVHAGELQMNLEVSGLGGDAWSLKTQCYRSNALPGEPCAWMPWTRQGNIQGEDHVTSAYRGTNPDAVQRAFEDKILESTCHLDNVTYEIGTETDQLVGNAGRTPKQIVDYELTMIARLRQYEEAHGCKRHLVGTNFPGDATLGWLRVGRYDYLNTHKVLPPLGFFDPKDFVRPLVNDEYNPEPALRPEAVQAFACVAREYGAYNAAWRHEMDDNPWKAALSLIAQDSITGCSEKMKTGCPYDVNPVMRIGCKVHAFPLHDCSPLDGRGAPIRKEGDATRAFCEKVAAGMLPTEGVVWSLANVTGSLSIAPRPNPFQFTAQGHGTGDLVCKVFDHRVNAWSGNLCSFKVVAP